MTAVVILAALFLVVGAGLIWSVYNLVCTVREYHEVEKELREIKEKL